MNIYFSKVKSVKLFLILFLFLVVGCSQPRYAQKISIDTLKVASPIIEKEIPATIINDTIIIGNTILKKDTLILVKYYPVEKKFYIKAKPDTVTILKIDTILQTIVEKKEEKKNNSLLWSIIIPLILVIILLSITKHKFKIKI